MDGKMRSVVDSKQWASVRDIDQTFVQKESNLYFGMVVDGVNPFANQSLKHSMWLVLIVIYNLPPWLLIRRFFVSLTVIIPGEWPYCFSRILLPLSPTYVFQ
jgi:hypothetical protein